MKRVVALVLALVSLAAGSQTIQTTNNLITSGANHTWTGVQTGTIPANYMPTTGSTSSPRYDPATNSISFSYNANAYVGQAIAVNQALANVGAGVKVNGYDYSYEVRNMNGDDRQTRIDTFTVATALRGLNNSTLLSTNQYFNTKFDWTTYSGTKTATTPYNLSDVTYLQIGVTGGDNGGWAGYFGPQIRNVNLSLKYSIDPCVTNPAYSPSCSGYNTVQTSGNIVAQSYAINQALNLSGANVMIHGFNYGYDYNVGNQYCSGWSWPFCWQWSDSSATFNVSMTDSSNATLYSNSHNHTGQNISGSQSYRYLFPSSRNLSTLGSVSFSVSTVGEAGISNVWSNFMYTPDPCTVDPLSSTTCPGYQQAYHDQQCRLSPLYASDCPGYTAAYFNQQCTISVLYNPACPGYQAEIDRLAAIEAARLEAARLEAARQAFLQSCANDPLFSVDCRGYQEAYNKKIALETVSKQSATTTQSTVIISTESPATVTSNPAAVAISDPVVSSAVSTPSTTSSTSPTSVTSVINAPAAATSTAAAAATTPAPAPAPTAEAKQEAKKTEGAVARAAARGNAAAAAKEAATSAANATSMEAQVATQGLVVGLMGYVPGFSAYQNAIVPDTLANAVARQYHRPTVDNRNAQRRLSGASDARWQEMVDSQYKLGN